MFGGFSAAANQNYTHLAGQFCAIPHACTQLISIYAHINYLNTNSIMFWKLSHSHECNRERWLRTLAINIAKRVRLRSKRKGQHCSSIYTISTSNSIKKQWQGGMVKGKERNKLEKNDQSIKHRFHIKMIQRKKCVYDVRSHPTNIVLLGITNEFNGNACQHTLSNLFPLNSIKMRDQNG